MTLVQTTLRRTTNGCGYIEQVVWLPEDKRVKIGSVISLKGEAERWTVYDQGQKIEPSRIEKRWGLGLPKSVRTER